MQLRSRAVELIASWPSQMPLAGVAGWARRIERLGFDTMHVPETVHDPFVVAALAATATERLTIRTSMVVAFPRSPMLTAYSAWDLATLSGGRFQLGVVSQVRGNIVGRFSTPWSEPAPRLADYVRALRAIFRAFRTDEELAYDGPHYRFTRLQPYFNPGPIEVPDPLVWTGGVNRAMTEVGGEVADGFVCHPTNSHPRVLEALLVPALIAGAQRAERTDGGPRIVANPQPSMAPTPDAVAAVRETRRREIAFLFSTPAYRPQLEVFGLTEIGEQLSALAQDGDWTRLPQVLPDSVLDELTLHGTYAEMPELLTQWYAGTCDGVVLAVPDDPTHDAALAELVARCRGIERRGA